MINGKYHKEYAHEGRKVIVDLADLGGEYEAMEMYDNGQEITCFNTTDIEIAKRVFSDMCERYEVQPLTGKYAKLRDDIKTAVEAGLRAVTQDPEDGGTCNLDAPTITLPRWKENRVIQAAEEAGSGAWVWQFGGKHFVLQGRGGQGNARTRYAEAVSQSLRDAGYSSSVYYAID